MVSPPAETAVHTDASGLQAGGVWVPAEGGEIPAYRASPESGGPFPVVLVVQEIFGVHLYIQDVCRRLAREGYLAIAPELYARQGHVAELLELRDIFTKVVMQVPDAQVLSDLDACATWAGTAKGDASRLGITGFCWGGRIVWLYANHTPGLRAGVAWYGRLVGDERDETPRHPVDVAHDLRAPVLGLYGAEDQGIPLDTVDRMKAALDAAGDPSRFVVYPGAPHGFHSDYRPSFRPDAASDGWDRMLRWFGEHGLG